MDENESLTDELLHVRATAVLVEDDRILLVRQQVSAERGWSLPGGRVQRGETIGQAVVRETREETGLEVAVRRLLWLSDKPDADPPLVHVTLQVVRVGGALRMATGEFDRNPISAVEMAPVLELERYGFSARFMHLALRNFPNAGSYVGLKRAIGL